MKILTRLVGVAVITLAILLLVFSPYQRARRTTPPMERASGITAVESYLTSTARLHYATWSHVYYRSSPAPLFPGLTVLALAGVAVVNRRLAPRGTRRMLIAVAVTGFVLSLGALTPVYVWAYYAVPPLQGLRAPIRFGILVFFALAALAGLGLSTLRGRWSPRWRISASAGLVVVAMLESLHAPMPYKRLDLNQPVHEFLASSADPGAVVELPIYAGDSFHRNAWYLLASTIHWRPLVNGFGGFQSVEDVERARVIGTFPSVVAMSRLRSLGVKFALVHVDGYRSQRATRQALSRGERRRAIELVAREGPERLYRVAQATPNRVTALLADLVWSDLKFVGPNPDGVFLDAVALGVTFGLQGPGQLITYMEDTTSASRLVLRVSGPMVGEFLDAESGEVLDQVTLQDPLAARSQTLVVPPGREAVILALRAR